MKSTLPVVAPAAHHVELELLGLALHSVDGARAVAEVPSSFFDRGAYRDLHNAIRDVAPHLDGAPPTPALLQAAAQARGSSVNMATIAEAIEAGVALVDPSPHVRHLRELAAQREEFAVQMMLHTKHERGHPGRDPGLWREVEERLARARALREGACNAGTLTREGLDLVLTSRDSVTFALAGIRDGREGVRGELAVTVDGRRICWGAWALSSTSARESLRKKLD